MRVFVLALLLAALAACADRSQEDRVATNPCVLKDSTDSGVSAVPWHPTLPGEIRFDVPAHLRSDTIFTTKKGAVRRRLTFELLNATSDEAPAVVAASLGQAGYVGGSAKTGAGGKVSIRYKKAGAPSVYVVVFPKLASNPANPDAMSMVSLSWQTKASPRTVEADP